MTFKWICAQSRECHRCASFYLSIVRRQFCGFFFFNDTATTEIYTLSLHDALPICLLVAADRDGGNVDQRDWCGDRVEIGKTQHSTPNSATGPIPHPAWKKNAQDEPIELRAYKQRNERRLCCAQGQAGVQSGPHLEL